MITGSAESPSVVSMTTPVADPSVYIVTFADMPCWGLRLPGVPPSDPCWPRGTQFGLGEVPLRLVYWAAPLSGFGRPSATRVGQGGDRRES